MSDPHTIRTVVDSSLLTAVAYTREATLELTFQGGGAYQYFAVPRSVLHGLLAADSKGAYFNRHIRHRYAYQRVA